MVFLDASAIIYLLEGDAAAQAAVRETLAGLRTPRRSPPVAVSALSRLECRVRPLREADQALVERYDAFFADPGLVVIALDGPVLDRATELRAHYRLRTPDALQAASLLMADEDGDFVTGDDDFAAVSGLRVHAVRAHPASGPSDHP